MLSTPNITNNHATWCDSCGEYLSTQNPGVHLFKHIICLACISKLATALTAQVHEDAMKKF